MFAKFTAVVLIALCINLSGVLAINAQTQNNREDENLRKTKTKVAKIFGEKRGKVTVKYNDGTKIKGYITEVKDDNFSVSDSKTGNITAVQYEQVKSVNKNAGLPTAAKAAIISAAVVVGLIVIIGIGISSSVN